MAYKLKVGFCRKNITPEGEFPLGGYGDDSRRICQGVRDPIFGTCLAITDEQDTTVLIFTVDLISARGPMVERLRKSVSEATGVPETHIHMASTHNHSSPGIQSPEFPSIQRFYTYFDVLMTEAAVGALADRAPAQLYLGHAYTERLNFVRHYKLENGNYAGDNFGRWNSPIVGHASEPDKQIQLIKVSRQAKPDILLMNWQGHTLLSSTGSDEARAQRYLLSADYPSACRRVLEEKTGMLVAYFLGASGNVNTYTRIKEEARTYDSHRHGKLLAETALTGLGDMQPIEAGPITLRRRTLTLEVDHSDDHLVPLAKDIWAIWTKDGNEGRKAALDRGFNSPFHANHVIARSKLGQSSEMTIDTVAMGELAFAFAPYEMFTANGLFIKEHAPYRSTVVATCANGAYSYFASEEAFEHGGYEVDSRKHPKGTAEFLADNFVQMLTEQKEEE